VRVHAEAPGHQLVEHFPLRLGLPTVCLAHSPTTEEQVAARGDVRVELAQGAGGGVTRVGKERFSRFGLGFVDTFEVGFGHQHLAAHFDQRRCIT